MSGQPQDVVLLVDIANVMGSRPDGWWHDRAAAATRLLDGLEPLNGAEVIHPAGQGTVRITEIHAVLEGAAKRAEDPAAVSVLRADRDGDSEIVEEADRLTASGKTPLVVTADRGLRGGDRRGHARRIVVIRRADAHRVVVRRSRGGCADRDALSQRELVVEDHGV